MITHGKDIKIFAANSNPQLAKDIANILGVDVGQSIINHFSDGEIAVNIYETVRGSDVFVVQSTSNPVNDNLMELLIMIDAFKRASAGRITAVIPYFGYARQDRKAKARDPISAKLVADLCIVSPDLGSVTRARFYADKLDCPIAIIDKRRPKANVCEVMNIIGDVKDKHVIMIDDMIDTAGTIANAAKALKDRGAITVNAACTHAVFSGPAIERLEQAPFDEVVILDTIALPEEKKLDKVKILSVAPVFAEAIDRIYEDLSVSTLFV